MAADPVSGPHAIVTGGAGFIGSHLVERLLASDHRVTVIDDLSTGHLGNLQGVVSHPNLVVIESRISACSNLDSLFAPATAIYHLAATVGVELVLQQTAASIQNNVRESEILLAAAARHRVPIVVASSSEVYGRSQKELLAEDDELIIGPPHIGRWSYAASKLAVEFLALALARERDLPVVVARIFNTVGPRQTGRYGMVLPRFIEAARSGQPLRVHGDGRQSRCFCSVHDTVEALIRLRYSPAAAGTVVNVGNNKPIEISNLATMVGRRHSSTPQIELVPYGQAYPAGFEDFKKRRPDLTKLARLTGFTPVIDLDEIIDELSADKKERRGP